MKALLSAAMESQPTFLLLFAPIVFSAWIGGLGPGLLATALCAAFAGLRWLPGMDAQNDTVAAMAWLALFIVEGVFVGALTASASEACSQHVLTQQRFRRTIEEAVEGVWVVDEHYRTTFVNSHLARILRCKPKEMIGRNVLDFFPEAERTQVATCLATNIPAERTPYEVRLQCCDGSHIWVLVTFMSMLDEDGRFVGGMATVLDITERKQAEDALREREVRMRTLIESSPDAVLVVNRAGHITLVNQQTERLFGYRRDELHGQHLELLIPQHERQAVREHHASAAPRQDHEPSVVRYESICVRKDGSEFPVEVSVNPIRLGEEVFLDVIRDITDRKLAENALRESEQQLAAVVDALSSPIAMVDQSRRIVMVNAAWREYGRARGSRDPKFGLGRDYVEVCMSARGRNAEGAAEAGQGILAVLEGRQPRYYQEYACHGPTERSWFQMRVRPMHYRGERRVVITHENITERKLAEERLEQQRDQLAKLVTQRTSELEMAGHQLRESERMATIGMLSAGLGHDIGNLLMIVRGRLDAIDAKGLPGEARDDLEALRAAAEYLHRLSRGLRLLTLAPDAATAGEAVDLTAWWPDTEPFLRNTLPRHVALRHRFAAGLPKVRVPGHLLTQAVFNLVHNAAKAMKDQPDGEVIVWAEAAPGQRYIRLGVTDTGPGMQPEIRQRALEPFQTATGPSGFTGFGLALIHMIVQRAGGTIEIESELGRGTTFIMTLPAAEAARPSAPPQPGGEGPMPRGGL